MVKKPNCQPNLPWSPDINAYKLDATKSKWLLRPGALTVGLRNLGNLQLTVLREFEDKLTTNEAWMVQCVPNTPIWVREIIMNIDTIPCVVARSFTPLADSFQVWQDIRGLNERPLADMLYHNKEIKRSPFWVCQLTAKQPLYQTVQFALGSTAPKAGRLYARCSTFWYKSKPLLVSECFLPQFWSFT